MNQYILCALVRQAAHAYTVQPVSEPAAAQQHAAFAALLQRLGVDSRPVCGKCWARYLCGGGCPADSTVYGPDRLEPQVQHCPFWRAEIEAAIRFYHRLVRRDPAHCLRLFGDTPESLLAAVDGQMQFMQRKNCL